MPLFLFNTRPSLEYYQRFILAYATLEAEPRKQIIRNPVHLHILLYALAPEEGLCVYCTYSVRKKETERGSGGKCQTALNQDAVSGPHVVVDVHCRHVAVCLRPVSVWVSSSSGCCTLPAVKQAFHVRTLFLALGDFG